MEFVQLTRFVLLALRSKGFNVLTSVNGVSHDDPTWIPARIEDIDAFLSEKIEHTPFQEKAILVIDDALENISEDQLIGMVWVE